MTRHPRMGAAEELKVPLREPSWNERATATMCENTGVYRLLWVNASGMRQLRRVGLLAVCGAITRRLLCVNVLKTKNRRRSWRVAVDGQDVVPSHRASDRLQGGL